MNFNSSSPKILAANYPIGLNHPVFIIAEIGINHNGDLEIAKKLIDLAVQAGADAVKFQKRTIETVYNPEERAKPREIPRLILEKAVARGVLPAESVERLKKSDFSETTNGDLKYALEFSREEYQEINRYCREKGILWFASCWDEASVDFIDQFNPPCYKIASASLTDWGLLKHTKSKGKPIIMSTGMSTLEEIDRAVEILGKENLAVLHCIATYPAKLEELNLLVIKTLQERYPELVIGYSGHETNLPPSVLAISLGASIIERHITLDRAMWGSDQAASLEFRGLEILVNYAKLWLKVKGDGQKRVYDSEIPVKKKLRRK